MADSARVSYDPGTTPPRTAGWAAYMAACFVSGPLAVARAAHTELRAGRLAAVSSAAMKFEDRTDVWGAAYCAALTGLLASGEDPNETDALRQMCEKQADAAVAAVEEYRKRSSTPSRPTKP